MRINNTNNRRPRDRLGTVKKRRMHFLDLKIIIGFNRISTAAIGRYNSETHKITHKPWAP